ncbi:MAG: VacB/RNase II family 3'-5' exoribonuclease, partial [Acholeplasmatales bacterium]|nr:VacB/RNase II family 3'-5' exoribonuclease [Acholeplasmatales bacterium]
ADRVIPMLPRKLSNGICSLNEGVDRLVLCCIMEIDLKGNLVNYDICEGVINSHHRMTYNNVNKILNNDEELCNKYSDILDMLNTMKDLSLIIRERRYKKGGIEFEVDEYKISLDEDGSPVDVVLRTRDTAEKLIEDFMLQANETVAYHMSIMNLPCVYRVHEKPDQEKLANVFSIISNMGINIKKTKNDIHPKQIQDALEKIADSSYKPIINDMLLRSMMKAKYYEKCLGHYGLAMNYYCHFTSPIRRYPDLMTHRLIKSLLIHPQQGYDDLSFFEQILPDICELNSISERKAIECEREVNDMLYAWYMEKYIHKSYTGIITSITSFGMFVTLPNGIEGLISFINMIGFYDYNEATMTLSNGKKKYRLGDSIKIVVLKADRDTRKIDFMLEDDYNRYEEDEY